LYLGIGTPIPAPIHQNAHATLGFTSNTNCPGIAGRVFGASFQRWFPDENGMPSVEHVIAQ
jgi:hypothetical protein